MTTHSDASYASAMFTSNRSMTFLRVGIVTTAAILDSMRSVADDLRDEQMREMLKLTPAERMELALQLGQRAVEMYMAANHVDRPTAIAALRRAGNAGRVPTKCHDEARGRHSISP